MEEIAAKEKEEAKDKKSKEEKKEKGKGKEKEKGKEEVEVSGPRCVTAVKMHKHSITSGESGSYIWMRTYSRICTM